MARPAWIDLEANWRRYALEAPGALYPLEEKFSECRGHNDLGVIFLLEGMDGSGPQHFAVLSVDDEGVVRDQGVNGYGMRVGYLLDMEEER